MNQLSAIIAQESGSSGLSSLIPLLLLLPLLYFMIVPQRKQRKQQAEFLAGVEVGDEVLTSGGIYGVINAVEGNEVHLEVDNDVVIRVLKSSLTKRSASTDAHDSDDSADEKTNDEPHTASEKSTKDTKK